MRLKGIYPFVSEVCMYFATFTAVFVLFGVSATRPRTYGSLQFLKLTVDGNTAQL